MALQLFEPSSEVLIRLTAAADVGQREHCLNVHLTFRVGLRRHEAAITAGINLSDS